MSKSLRKNGAGLKRKQQKIKHGGPSKENTNLAPSKAKAENGKIFAFNVGQNKNSGFNFSYYSVSSHY